MNTAVGVLEGYRSRVCCWPGAVEGTMIQAGDHVRLYACCDSYTMDAEVWVGAACVCREKEVEVLKGRRWDEVREG